MRAIGLLGLGMAIGLPVVADSSSERGSHPSELEGAALYLDSTSGLQIARCGTEACFAAGGEAPLESQYCDLESFPEGCVYRWLDPTSQDEPSGNPSSSHRSPESRDPRQKNVVQRDADKPGLLADCLGGEPCLSVGPGVVQARSLEIAPVIELEGPFSLFLLVRPKSERGGAFGEDFFYFGHGGGELVHRSARNSVELRVGAARPVEVMEPGAVIPGRWQLLEVHRDSRSAVRGLVDGWDRTPDRPVMTGKLALRHLFSIGRARAMHGDVAAVAVFGRRLREFEAQGTRDHLARIYGLAFGDGSPPAKNPGRVELERRLWLDWSFDDIRDCRGGFRGQLAISFGPKCPGNAPRPVAGRRGAGLQFDGVDDEVRSVGPLGPMDQLYSFTAAGWIKTESAGRWQTVLDKRDALEDGWDLYLDPQGRGFLRVDQETLGGERMITDGEWHHLAGVYDGERMLLYVDGRLDRSRYLGRRPPVETSREVAAGRNFAGRRDAFAGVLDELKIYGRALDPQEIESLAEHK